VAFGIVTVGGLGIGIISFFSGLAVGLVALGGLATGGIAIGGGAIGFVTTEVVPSDTMPSVVEHLVNT